MSDMGLEAPDADSAEQKQDAFPQADDDDDAAGETPLEADQADTAEQSRELDMDDDDYR
jgi:hypothetical protein